jgi:hypothetical protein
VPRSGKIAAPVTGSPLENLSAGMRPSQYLTVVGEVLSDSRKTTLRPEDANYLVRLVTAVTPISATKAPAKSSPTFGADRYPVPLMREYHALVDKKLHRTITSVERTRLQEVRNQIAAIDGQRPIPDIWDIQAQKLRQELAEIRAEVEALPDAVPTVK